ncbi:hypothetical protein GV054_13720 [Marinomonas mediterranea]|uniref:hypothetical protein n=1 Tax=Marinomonas mediterranea TaxID=119864 RepID=UPI00234A341E|nr:hypothetical protein [Marinomonas mediterranea]WCN13981.1 hypothetical protein GV054_13720 [Marinomonas mediterranea]
MKTHHTTSGNITTPTSSNEKEKARRLGIKQLADLSTPIDIKTMMSSVDAVLEQAMQSINTSLQLTTQQVDEARQRLMQDHPSLQSIYQTEQDEPSDHQRSDSVAMHNMQEQTLESVDSIYGNAKKRLASFQSAVETSEQNDMNKLRGLDKELDKESEALEQKYQEQVQSSVLSYQNNVASQHDTQNAAVQKKQEALTHSALLMQQKLVAQQQSYEQQVLSQSGQALATESQAAQQQLDNAKDSAQEMMETTQSSIESNHDPIEQDLDEAKALLDNINEVKK